MPKYLARPGDNLYDDSPLTKFLPGTFVVFTATHGSVCVSTGMYGLVGEGVVYVPQTGGTVGQMADGYLARLLRPGESVTFTRPKD